MQIGAGEHLGVTFHRLKFAIQPAEATAVFGDNVGLTLGMGSTAIWGVIGGEESLATLKGVMDKLEAATQSPTDVRTPPSFRVIVNVNQLVEMAETAQVASASRRAEREAAAGAEAAAELQVGSTLHPLRAALPLPVAPVRPQAVDLPQQGVVAASVVVPTLPVWLKELSRAAESLAKHSKKAMIASKSTPDSQKPVPAAVFGSNRVS
ncbi:MAG UNVERIFIED_CONTAM: hypothetical protein LVR18_32715 [Planctomycetaceae bacterium]